MLLFFLHISHEGEVKLCPLKLQLVQLFLESQQSYHADMFVRSFLELLDLIVDRRDLDGLEQQPNEWRLMNTRTQLHM